MNLYADGSLPLWPVGPSSFTDPTRRRVTSSLARRLTRHLLVRPPVLALWASGFGSSCLAPGPNSRNRRFSSDITAVVTNWTISATPLKPYNVIYAEWLRSKRSIMHYLIVGRWNRAVLRDREKVARQSRTIALNKNIKFWTNKLTENHASGSQLWAAKKI